MKRLLHVLVLCLLWTSLATAQTDNLSLSNAQEAPLKEKLNQVRDQPFLFFSGRASN